MLLDIADPAGRPRMTVFSYDIACPRRSARMRRILEPLQMAKQYSVIETMLSVREFQGILAEVTLAVDLRRDRLCVWWPRNGSRIVHHRRNRSANSALPKSGNYIVCYDVSDPRALQRVGGIVARETVMLQRSVYWLRGPAAVLGDIFACCDPHLTGEHDRLWAYPLAGADDLWQIGPSVISALPIARHRWAD